MSTSKSIRLRTALISITAMLFVFVLVPFHTGNASCIPYDCVDPDSCITTSPEDFVQQELLPSLQDDVQALETLNFTAAEYVLLYDVLYLDRSSCNLFLWDGQLLAVCIPYKAGTMGSMQYRFYAAQDPIKCALLWVPCIADQ